MRDGIAVAAGDEGRAQRRAQADAEPKLKLLDAELRQASAEYAALAGTEVLSIERVQELLTADPQLD